MKSIPAQCQFAGVTVVPMPRLISVFFASAVRLCRKKAPLIREDSEARRLMALPTLRGIGPSWHTGYIAARRALIPDQSRLVFAGLSSDHLYHLGVAARTGSPAARRRRTRHDEDFPERDDFLRQPSATCRVPVKKNTSRPVISA